MRFFIILFAFGTLIGCKNKESKDTRPLEGKPTDLTENKRLQSLEEYQNEKWDFSLQYPSNYALLESELPGNSPVINVYPGNSKYEPPFAIHEEPDNSYIAILPKGFGVDGPSGKRKNFMDWEPDEPLDIQIDREESKAYLLENGDAWAYFLKLDKQPEQWQKYGGVFVNFKTSEFKVECFDPESGEPKKMSDCDPMGMDEVRYSGKVDKEDKKQLHEILNTIEFGNIQEQDISDVIQVEKPLPNMDVTSPLKIKGKARGYWFFEADAPIAILDKDFNEIAEGYIKADGEWMTKDFVNFQGTIQFDAPNDERGYLLFKRANPSDKKENDQEYRIPVIFPPK